MIRARVSEVREVAMPRHTQGDGELVVIEQGVAVPFPVLRTFIVRAAEGAVRGRHAHKQCAQFLICVQGVIDVECDDGESKLSYELSSRHQGLLIPPGVWASQRYRESAILCVLCDRHYEVEDYLRDYQDFLAWRSA